MENTLKQLLFQVMDEYAAAYETVNKTHNYKHALGTVIRNDIPNEIRASASLDLTRYIVKGSNGAGRWTTVPWIAVFDRNITTSAQRGVYIVYLLNKETKELFLTLNQGATGVSQSGSDTNGEKSAFTGVTGVSTGKALSRLKDNACEIRSLLGEISFNTDDDMACGAPNYDAGAICYKKYTLDLLPDDRQLYADLKAFVELYAHYAEKCSIFSDEQKQWWPSKEEYDPGIGKEQWLRILTETDVFGNNAKAMLAAMYKLGGAATCSTLSSTYGKPISHYIMTAVHAAERVAKYTNCPIMQGEKNSKLWPVLFIGRQTEKEEHGDWVWKIRPELHEALAEYDIEQHLPNSSRTGTFDSWEIIDENTAIKTCDKSFFERNNSGVPKQICWFFDADDLQPKEEKQFSIVYGNKRYPLRVVNESTDRRRTGIYWGSELGRVFNDSRNNLVKVAFVKIDSETFEITLYGGEKEMTIKEKVAAIKAYIAARGFNYEGDLIENFYLSLKSKPFVILAGTSGTGKTRLVKLFADAIGAEMKPVPVRPDWSDSSDLFGHNDLSGNFHPGAIIDFIKQAERDPSMPHFLCLDEMNLARVEYYLSDFLSVIETRDRKDNGVIETDTLVEASYFQSAEAREKYGRVYIPENLYIIGTVNMDETTFPFSKKVLDRANTIEFSFVNLMARVGSDEQPVPQALDNGFLKAEYLYLRDCDDEDLIDTVCFNLEELNQILAKANLHIGYRVRDEISFYMMNNQKYDLLAFDVAFDNELMQKILPRIQGSSESIEDVLSELFIKCAGDYTGFAGTTAYEQMNSYLESKTCKYPNSAKKIAFMMRRYKEDGFTSYWL